MISGSPLPMVLLERLMLMMYFASYKTDTGEKKTVEFYTIEKYFEWLQEYWNKVGSMPKSLCVFKAECVFDGS